MLKFKKRLLKLNEKLEKRMTAIEKKKDNIKRKDEFNVKVNLSMVQELNQNVYDFERVMKKPRLSNVKAPQSKFS